MTINPGMLSKLKTFNSLRQRQVALPVAKIRAKVSPLTVRDDLSLKTMVVSVDNYDRILCKLLYDNTELIDMKLPDGKDYEFKSKPSFDEFLNLISDFDKQSLLYGLYYSTYHTFNKQKIVCPSCKNEWEEEINCDHIITKDTFRIWNEPIEFSKYLLSIDIEVSNNPAISKFRFNTKVPTMRDHLNILKLISSDKMKDNFDKFHKILSTSEELTLITQSIEIFTKVTPAATEENPEPEETEVSEKIDGILDVYKTINEYIPLNIIEDISKQYSDKFSHFSPKFKKEIRCDKCKNDFDFPVDIEVALFRSFLKI
jgi:hypothetical protein